MTYTPQSLNQCFGFSNFNFCKDVPIHALNQTLNVNFVLPLVYQCYVFTILVFNLMPNTKLFFPSQTSGPCKIGLVFSLHQNITNIPPMLPPCTLKFSSPPITKHYYTQKNPINYVYMCSWSPMTKPSNLWPVRMVKNTKHQCPSPIVWR